jgi:hypothetical protein
MARVWCFEHCCPLSAFDLTNEEELKKAMHWMNIRPYCKIRNSEKKCIKSILGFRCFSKLRQRNFLMRKIIFKYQINIQMAYYFSTGTGIKNHDQAIPPSFRMLVCGASGCGKSSLVMRLLLEKELLNYDKLYVFSKSLYQPEYQILVNGFKYGLTKSNMLKILRIWRNN